MDTSFRLFPPEASTTAYQVDHLLFFLLGVSAFFTVLIFVLIVYFALRYRRRQPNEFGAHLPPHYGLEIVWTVIPLLLVMVMFGWSATLFVRMSKPPRDALEIHVIGKQWMWKIQHPTGAREIDELHVPLGRPVKLVMTSQDVIHSFFIPAFRTKQDVVPGRYTEQWFTPTQLGEFHLFCAEYCGTSHSRMRGRVVVMKPSEYEAWLAGVSPDLLPAQSGERLFASFGCNTCHGERAPTLAGLYNSPVELADGQTVVADEAYLRESILDPAAKLVKGFAPIMPTFRGQVSEEQLYDLVAYVKSLQDTREPAANSPSAAPRSTAGAPTTQPLR
jgi:cytochrome c oxidase subunit 2